jgi:outer membrane biosynthesis protein TonB
VGGNVQAASLRRKVDRIHPAEAKAAHIEGAVVFHVVIEPDGRIKKTEIVSGDPALAKAAADGLRQ